jgi:predicted amidohydrolase
MARYALLACIVGAATLGQAGTNLMPVSAEAWHTWSPRSEITPKLEIAAGAEGPTLSMKATSFEQYGQWYTVVKGVRAGSYYRFSVLRRAESVDKEDVSVAAMLSWCKNDCTEDAIERDYVDRESEAGDWRSNFRVLQAPEGAQAVKVELVLRWTARGSVVWKQASLTETEAPKKRIIRVATTRVVPEVPSTIEKNLQMIGDMLDKAGAAKADVVCLSENVVGRGLDMALLERARLTSSRILPLLAEKARRYRMYIVTTFEQPDGNAVYNTAVLIDREGRQAAKYRKVHLPLAEAEMGYTPGSDYSVVDTDFGRVGILICWDNWFSEPARILRLKGAELLLWPLAGDSVAHLDAITRARAFDNGVYLVASTTTAGANSRIVDPMGEVLGEASGRFDLVVKDIDLNREFREVWLSVGPGLGEGKSLYLKERRPETYGPVIQDTHAVKQ